MQIERYPLGWTGRLSDKDADLINQCIPVMMEMLALKKPIRFQENQRMSCFNFDIDGNTHIQMGYHPYFSLPEVLAHELVHAKQYEEGRLRSYEFGIEYNGQKFDRATELIREHDSNLPAYMKIPWEVEPYEYMTELSRRCLKAIGVEFQVSRYDYPILSHSDEDRYGPFLEKFPVTVLKVPGFNAPDCTPSPESSWWRSSDIVYSKMSWKKVIAGPVKKVKEETRHWVKEKRNFNWKHVA